MINKVTGNSNYSLFVKDLKNKWEEAYRTKNTKIVEEKNSLNSGVENDNDIDYNKDEIYINDKQEYAKVMKSVHDKMSLNLDYRGFDVAYTDNYFYIFDNQGFDNKPVIKSQISIIGNENLINNLESEVKNETYSNSKTIDSIIEEIYQRRRINNWNNVNVEGKTPTRNDDRLYNKKSTGYKQEPINKQSNENNRELNSSSFLYTNKKEVNSRIKKLEKLIYGTGSTATQFEKETYKDELKSLKQLKKTLPGATKSEILPSVEDPNIKNFDFTESDLKKLDKEIKNIIRIVDDQEFINGNYMDEVIYSTDYYQDNYIDENSDIPMSENQIDKYNEKLHDDIYDKIIEKLKDEGISLRYEHDQAVYDRQDLAIKGYNELLDYLDNKNISYEISRSTEAGYVPSVYIKDTDGNVIYRIANHFNNSISEFDKVYNDSYKTTFKDKDYANWEDRILPTLEKEGVFEELEDSSFSNDDTLSLEQRVSGNKLLDTQDFINEIKYIIIK